MSKRNTILNFSLSDKVSKILKVMLLNFIYKVGMQIKRTGNWQFKNLQAHFLYVHLKKIEKKEIKKNFLKKVN